jgi:hypothetical protein
MLDELRIFGSGILLKKRGFLLCLILFFAFFTFYYVFALYVIRQAIPSAVSFRIIQASFTFVIALVMLLTSFFIHRIKGLSIIYICSTAASTAIILLLLIPNEVIRIALIFVVGVFFGIGELVFFAYFCKLTVPEERGRIGGFVAFISLPLYFLIGVGLAGTLDFLGTAVLSLILILGTIAVTLLRPKVEVLTSKKDMAGNTYERRVVILYSIPWIVFSLINATLAGNISSYISQQVSSYFYLSLLVLQLIAGVFGALIGGVIADLFGRRLPLAFSLTLYGIGSALAGLTQNYAVYYFVYIASGLSWGILLTMYSFVVWGDLANEKNYFKMYAIGLTTFFSATGVGLLTQLSQIPLIASSLASCMLIFISNIPVILAPELLPSDFREKIKLKLHMTAVKKISEQSQNQG